MSDVSLDLSPAQRESIGRAFTPNSHGEIAKVCIWDGAIRSGKTIASLFAFLMACADPPPGGAVVVVGRTRDSIARNVFDVLMDPSLFGEFASLVSYTPGASTAKIYGRTVHILGASDVRSEMVLRGLTVGLAYVDELTLISEPFWTQLLGRMSPPGSRIFATTNPDGPHHWAHRMVIKRVKELGYKRFHFMLADNEWLMKSNPSYVAQLDREYVGLWRRRFLNGEWVQAEGAVYEEWDEERHVVRAEDVPTLDAVLGVALDFGTQHPTRAYALGIGPDHQFERTPATDPRKIPRRLYVVAEFAPEPDMSPGRQSTRFREWLERVEAEFGAPEWVFVDPAARHFRAQLADDGLVTFPAHNAKDGGIQTLNALLAIDGIVVSDACPALIEHVPGYMWDPKAAARGEDEPIKENDDELDAWRYVVYSTRRFWRDIVRVSAASDHAAGVRDLDEYAAA
ncbi:PBSX family phage terminase large subunit [Microbacterium lacticum]|uniref:PBSX family phage terminase large subunit n=1 Tax=Microbacterium lacticum TaxID=33885 RepID=A0A4Y3UIQ2_9MICO|nr:terminase family protein [Microbacterium lacticum]TQN00755.1 PBSX family phage terminase large subunit [Microbacterium lacticum]GEB94163.1 phage terminase large subunit [Microbacterium lacticum]GGN13811.1 phage terminase large subunit [Microbacterium lacticum]